jgi:hypothetical protein
LVVFLGGCSAPPNQPLEDQDPHAPGELIGFFSITGKLANDSCGAAALNAPAKWEFQLKLSREGSTLYWLNGREAIVGDIDRSGKFSFETHLDVPVSPARGSTKGCTLVRGDAATGSLKSERALEGELRYSYDAAPGSDCDLLPLGTDGLPSVLPCELSYALSGSRVSGT